MKSPFGFLIVDKPSGLTSHDCVNVIRKIFNIRKVGHGGTLDPAVTGVLPIAVGNATRLLPYLPEFKTYLATIQLGLQTSTDDMEGELISRQKCPLLEESTLQKYLEEFRGTISQQPPRISSVHLRGERAYKRARRGEKFDLPTRSITIHELKLLKWDSKTEQLTINVHCSSGTYIRSLARDLGNSIQCGGCLSRLRRTQAQGFREEQAIPLPKIQENNLLFRPNLINPLEALTHLSKIKLKNENELNCWRKGQQITRSIDIEYLLFNTYKNKQDAKKAIHPIAVVNHKNELAGIGELVDNHIIKPKVVFNAYG